MNYCLPLQVDGIYARIIRNGKDEQIKTGESERTDFRSGDRDITDRRFCADGNIVRRKNGRPNRGIADGVMLTILLFYLVQNEERRLLDIHALAGTDGGAKLIIAAGPDSCAEL